MKSAYVRALAAAFALAGIGSAHAITCYVVFDRNDNVIYRDVYPPVDMSERGIAEREALRRRGEFLMFGEVERCPQVEFVLGAAGSVGLDLAGTMPASTIPPPATPPPPGLSPSGPARGKH
jgi:hypothetical protein